MPCELFFLQNMKESTKRTDTILKPTDLNAITATNKELKYEFPFVKIKHRTLRALNRHLHSYFVSEVPEKPHVMKVSLPNSLQRSFQSNLKIFFDTDKFDEGFEISIANLYNRH